MEKNNYAYIEDIVSRLGKINKGITKVLNEDIDFIFGMFVGTFFTTLLYIAIATIASII